MMHHIFVEVWDTGRQPPRKLEAMINLDLVEMVIPTAYQNGADMSEIHFRSGKTLRVIGQVRLQWPQEKSDE